MSEYQQGGLAAATAQPPSDEPVANSLLRALAQPHTTTAEAKKQASEILQEYRSGEAFAPEKELLEKFRETAESSRQALREARERVLGRKRDPAQRWFKVAAALGRPTRTGAFGESLGHLAGTLSEDLEAQQAFEQAKQAELMGLQTQMQGIDQSLLQNELALAQMRRRAEAGLAERALTTMGKSTADPRASATKVLDRTYLTNEYVPFISGGSADAAKGIEELGLAVKQLKSGKTSLTGPFVGSVSTLPFIGKAIQDVIWPKGTAVREMVETSVQRSLRPILGSQFTAQEGTRLIERVYNPRLPEKVIAERVDRLREQLERAYREKIRMAQYFEKNRTLEGFEGKVDWTVSDFLPDDNKEVSVRMPDGSLIQVKPGTTRQEAIRIWKEQNEPQMAKGGKVKKTAQALEKDFRALSRRVTDPDLKKRLEKYLKKEKTRPSQLKEQAYAEGGEVAQPLSLDDLPDEESEELSQILGEGALGAGVGAGVGAAAGDVATRVQGAIEGVPSRYSTAPEHKILRGIEASGGDLEEMARGIKRGQRQGVPETLMDTGDMGTQIVAEEAIEQGSPLADDVLEEMSERMEEGRQRVAERINKSLKPYPYFEHMNRLTSDLYENARPLYEEAYRVHPGISINDVPALSKVLQTPDGKRAVKMALRLLRNRGKKIGKEDATGLVRRPSLEFLDYVKRGFDQIISKEENMGSTTLGRSMRDLRNELRSQLDAVAPEYAAARSQYAGDLEVLDALQGGRDQFMRLTPEEINTEIEAMSPAEHRAYRTGVAQRLYETIHRPTSQLNAARRLIGSPAMREKLRLLFKKESEARIFEEALNREMKLFDRLRRLHRRGAGKRERRLAKDIAPIHPLRHAGTLSISPLMGTLRILLHPRELGEKKADEILKILRKGTPKEIDEMVKRLAPIARHRKRLRTRRGRAAKVGAAVGAVTAPFIDEIIDTED